MSEEIKQRFLRWNQEKLSDGDLNEELRSITGRDAAVEDRFYKDLEFGTGGLRGIIGAGTNRMNIYTVAKATQGYCNYLNRTICSRISVAIAYDSRLKSDVFARTAAEVFAGNGINVYFFPELMPTPVLSFAVRHLNCDGGVVITASHNPSQYNGYKVYGKDGCQITTEAAKDILAEINALDIFKDVRRLSFEEAEAAQNIQYINEDVIDCFIAHVLEQSLSEDKNKHEAVSIVYTPLNGAGLKCVTRCLSKAGFLDVKVVGEQELPDQDFTTCPRPNPEEKEALKLALRDAKRYGSELVLATDPDCDRVGIAVKHGNDYVLLNGNETGILMCRYICERRTALGKMPKAPVILKTIVTTDFIEKIASDFGVKVVNVLTGFKFIGEYITWLESCDRVDDFIFGAEESYGYLSGTYVRDKDGVNAAMLICEMFAYYKSQGKSLIQILDDLYKKYGYHMDLQRNYAFEGAEGFRKMQAMMENLRQNSGRQICGLCIKTLTDYKNGIETDFDKNQVTKVDLPSSNVLKMVLDHGLSFVIRPSGTEPKLKVYVSACGGSRVEAENKAKNLFEKIEGLFDR